MAEADIDELQRLLDALPAPLEPLDVTMLDGFLCGVLVQPARVPPARWLGFVTDADGRPLPRGVDVRRLHVLVLRREEELRAAIGRRRWFDPWVFEFDAAGDGGDIEGDAVQPWAAGFASALAQFPGLLERVGDSANEALALVFRHVDAGDLEDADELLLEIEAIGPAADLADAVEGLVRATLLLADAAGVPELAR